MATKTFEELKQLAIQIRDEKTDKQNTATRIGTQMLEHLNKLEQDYYDKTATDEELKQRDEKLTELSSSLYNVTNIYGGKYTLEEAIKLVPSKYRVLGIEVRFINSQTNLSESWTYIGTDSNSWGVSNFVNNAGFNGEIFDTLENPYNLDNLQKAGIYIKKNGTQYILFVKNEEDVVRQIRIYVTDVKGNKVFSERTLYKESQIWSEWKVKEIAFDSTTWQFDGYIDTDDVNANNYIDKVITTGVYKRNRNGYPIIYFIKTVLGVVYQTQMYFSDGLELAFRTRNNAGGVWSEWSYDVFTFNIYTFKFSELDNLKSYGTYYCSDTYNSGIVSVMKSDLQGYDFKQIVILNDTNTGNLKKGIRHHETDGNWMDWGWSYVDDNSLYSQIAKNGINFNWSSYPKYNGYLSQRDLSVNPGEGYRIVSIPIEDIPEGKIFISIPAQSGAILLVSYWKGDYNDKRNYLGRDSITAYSLAGNFMYNNIPLGIIPDGTTNIVLSWNNTVGNPIIKVYNPDLNNGGGSLVSGNNPKLYPSMYLGQRELIYTGIKNTCMYKRAALLNIVGSHSDLIIVAGQSNADGRAEKKDAPQWLVDMNYKIDNYMMWNPIAEQFQSWELGVNTGSEDNASNQFGFDIFFAKKYLDDNPNKQLYAIKQTVGGTPISPKRDTEEKRAYCWTPQPELITDGGISMCEQLIEKLKKAFDFSLNNNLNLAFQALLWHQGEADMTDVRRSDYKENLENLFCWFRGLFSTPALPIINGFVADGYNTWYPTDNANVVFKDLNEIDSFFKTVDMTGKETIDDVHFTAESQQYLGEQMYLFYNYFNQ